MQSSAVADSSPLLNYMQDEGFINDWESAGKADRHDYAVSLDSGQIAIVESKDCLDGNKTNIFQRPPNADEFIIRSICTNTGADPRHNVLSLIHTRLSAELISREQRVDGIAIWDMAFGTIGRPNLKLQAEASRVTIVEPSSLPPPCLYVLPSASPSPRNNPASRPQWLFAVQIMPAFNGYFQCTPEEINNVRFEVAHRETDTVRTTRIVRDGAVQRERDSTAIRRS